MHEATPKARAQAICFAATTLESNTGKVPQASFGELETCQDREMAAWPIRPPS